MLNTHKLSNIVQVRYQNDFQMQGKHHFLNKNPPKSFYFRLRVSSFAKFEPVNVYLMMHVYLIGQSISLIFPEYSVRQNVVVCSKNPRRFLLCTVLERYSYKPDIVVTTSLNPSQKKSHVFISSSLNISQLSHRMLYKSKVPNKRTGSNAVSALI